MTLKPCTKCLFCFYFHCPYTKAPIRPGPEVRTFFFFLSLSRVLEYPCSPLQSQPGHSHLAGLGLASHSQTSLACHWLTQVGGVHATSTAHYASHQRTDPSSVPTRSWRPRRTGCSSKGSEWQGRNSNQSCHCYSHTPHHFLSAPATSNSLIFYIPLK